MKVLQIFESYGCLDINEEDPQGHGGEADPSFCTHRKIKAIYIKPIQHTLMPLISYRDFPEHIHKQEQSQHKPEELSDYFGHDCKSSIRSTFVELVSSNKILFFFFFPPVKNK